MGAVNTTIYVSLLQADADPPSFASTRPLPALSAFKDICGCTDSRTEYNVALLFYVYYFTRTKNIKYQRNNLRT